MSMTFRSRDGVSSALGDIQMPVRGGLEAVSNEIWRIVADDCPLIEDVNHHLMATKGKLFRPTLVLLANAADETPSPRAVTMAAVIELLHVASLVHDDSVDHSSLRRGMPTVNSLFSHQVSVIMGDYLYARALREIVRGADIDALRVLTEASNEMTLGEMRQLASFDRLAFTEADYDALIRAKTASLFSAACEVGALCGAPSHREALKRYGERLGMAFQVADDLLDYTEAQEMTGKPTGLDLREHKVTLPLIAAMRTITPAARSRVEALFEAAEPTDAAIAEVIGIVSEAGGLEYARRRGDQFAQEAEESLAGLPDTPARTALTDAIGYVMDRRW
ncbi:MAG TPA: polyprenyl synthetase family protein [Gaiellaceae bacterium]|nr:polyprenyl synthetase family protein [Gaiellaceae bacterium]